jgi:hypothetical protein
MVLHQTFDLHPILHANCLERFLKILVSKVEPKMVKNEHLEQKNGSKRIGKSPAWAVTIYKFPTASHS